MLALQDRAIDITETLRSHSLIKTLSALFLFAVCIGGDIFLINQVHLFFYFYFTFCALLFLILLRRKPSFEFSYAVIPLLLFTGLCFVSLFWSVRLKDAEIVIVSIFTGLLTYLIFSNLITDQKDIDFFSKTVVIATSLNALVGIFQGMVGGSLFTLFGSAAQGTTYHPNYFSGFLTIVYPMALLISVKDRRNVWLLPAFLILLASYFSTKRGGILTILILSAAALWFLFAKGYKKSGIKLLSIIFLSVLIYLSCVFTGGKLSPHASNLKTISITSTSVSRLEIWQGALSIILHHPLLGAGLRSFEDQFRHLNNPYLFKYHSNAHNLFLHLASEIGVIGLLFFMAFSVHVLSCSIMNYRHTKPPPLRIASFFLLLSLFGFFFHNLGEYEWEHPLFQVLFFFLASAILSTHRFLAPNRKKIVLPLSSAWKIGLTGFLIVFWILYVGSPSLGSYYLGRAKQFLKMGDERAFHEIAKASWFDSSHPEPYAILSQTCRQAWLHTKNDGFLEKAIDAQKKAIALFPMNSDFYLELARLFEEAKRADEAKLNYEEAIHQSPQSPRYKEEFAAFLARTGDIDKAIGLWEDLRTFFEKFEPEGMSLMRVYLHLGRSYKRRGDLESSKKYLNEVLRFSDNAVREDSNRSDRKNFSLYKETAREELTTKH